MGEWQTVQREDFWGSGIPSASAMRAEREVESTACAREWGSFFSQVQYWSFPTPPPWQLEDWQEMDAVNLGCGTGFISEAKPCVRANRGWSTTRIRRAFGTGRRLQQNAQEAKDRNAGRGAVAEKLWE